MSGLSVWYNESRDTLGLKRKEMPDFIFTHFIDEEKFDDMGSFFVRVPHYYEDNSWIYIGEL